METPECSTQLHKSVGIVNITPSNIAEVEKCCERPDNLSWHMSLNCWEVDLQNEFQYVIVAN